MSQIADASFFEASHLVKALERDRTASVEAVCQRAKACDSNENCRLKARLSVVALCLGNTSLLEEMCSLSTDPIKRSIFVDEYRSFPGDLVRLDESAESIDDPALRFPLCLCLGVGSVAPELIRNEQKRVWQVRLKDWYQNSGDAQARSAAGWALRKWKLGLPSIAPSERCAPERNWYVNSVGMTMIRIPSGTFTRKVQRDVHVADQQVTLTRSFLLSDREVSAGLFWQFVDDPGCPDEDKPDNWREAHKDYGLAAHPARYVNWYDAVLFCNWLSRKEGLRESYRRTGEKEPIRDYDGNVKEYGRWQIVADGNGYRLPTEAEWEYACRATTTTEFAFGNDDSLLDSYAVYRMSRVEICGSKMPNGWGLFDMHGNVWEWCQDRYGVLALEDVLTDPHGPEEGNNRVVRGGSFNNVARHVRSAERWDYEPGYRAEDGGLRVARTCPVIASSGNSTR